MFRDTNNTSTQREIAFSPTIPVNVWTHITCVYKRGEIWIYQNGIQTAHSTAYYHATSTLLSDMGEFRIGRQQSTSSNSYYTGKVNDFRIYDHCLSAAEVHEISQGLVLHYKLDSPYIESTTNILSAANSYISPTTLTITHASSTNKYINIGNITTAAGNNIVTYSAYINNTSNSSIYPRIRGLLADGSSWGSYVNGNTIAAGASGWVSVTLNMTDAETYLGTNVYLRWQLGTARNAITSNPTIQYAQLEVKNYRTPWTLGGTTRAGIIDDSSGYGHNGTITGTLTPTAETKRYSASTYFNGSSYILTPAGSFAWNDLTKLTLSAWIKPTASVSSWTGSIGIAADTGNTARGFSITDYANTFRVTYGNGSFATQTSGKTLTVNEWHHCAATLDGTTCNMYFDGVLVKTVTIDWGSATLNTNARFQVGIDIPGTDEKFTGNYSDIRMYCTALSADDILTLYHTSAKVDNLQNLHTREIVENQSAIKVTKQGQLKEDEIQEDTTTKFYKTNKIIKTKQAIEF